MTTEDPIVDYEAIEEKSNYVKKLKFMCKIAYLFMFFAVVGFVIGAYFLVAEIQTAIQGNFDIKFTNLWWSVLICGCATIVFIVLAILVSYWNKKSIENYSSKTISVQRPRFKPLEAQGKAAKKGLSDGAEELEVKDAKLGFKFCKNCGAKIPIQSTGNCPKCGKPL